MGRYNKYKRYNKNINKIEKSNITDANSEILEEAEININHIKNIFNGSSDILFRKVNLHYNCGNFDEATLIFTDGLVDNFIINEGIIKRLNMLQESNHSKDTILNFLQDNLLVNDIKKTKKYEDITHTILSGDTVLFIDGLNEVFLLDTKGFETRNVEESSVESVIRGSKESFIESIRTNTALIRRKLKDPNLVIQPLTIGTRTNTTVAVVYINDIVNQQLLQDILNKLEEIKIEGVFDSGYIEQLLINNNFSILPQMLVTERPDKVCANLLEGRISILVDGSPDALILPVGLFQFFQSPEDYYERVIYGNIVRFIRFIGFIIATTFPAIYVAITTFHQEILPTDFILDIAKTRVEVPFPPVIEAFLMEGTIELLREASVRLPSRIGQTIGIVGALVIGDAAVRAGIISPIMVIVVAITAIGSYILPHFSTSYAIRFIRIPMILMAATFGAFGIIITWTWIIAHMCRINSFGYAYLTPIAPIYIKDLKDTVFRAQIGSIGERPLPASNKNKKIE
ncbi:spore germination protein [Alkaliphilus transvaalensis]|uniref:spore germination protein n=1 Tax=Alkaliphilus transvaalensis TaxID=114628 RepID=UPI000559662B|nr:spore germination protein [Alkaliphilus transvaalensis]